MHGEKRIVTTLQARAYPRVGEVGARDQGPVRPVHSGSCRLLVGGQAETFLALAQDKWDLGVSSSLQQLPLNGGRRQISGAVQMFRGDSGKWSRWDSCGGWGRRAAAGGCAGACARAELGSSVCWDMCHRVHLGCGSWADCRLGQVALGAFHVLATKICPKLSLAVAGPEGCTLSAMCCARIQR